MDERLRESFVKPTRKKRAGEEKKDEKTNEKHTINNDNFMSFQTNGSGYQNSGHLPLLRPKSLCFTLVDYLTPLQIQLELTKLTTF